MRLYLICLLSLLLGCPASGQLGSSFLPDDDDATDDDATDDDDAASDDDDATGDDDDATDDDDAAGDDDDAAGDDDDAAGDDDDSAGDDDDDAAGDDDDAAGDDDDSAGDDDDSAGDDDDATPPDVDGDGWDASVDCDDNDDTVMPGAPELCDGLDNDCDGLLSDEEVDDLDLDGYTVCGGDCNDFDSNAHPGQTAWFSAPQLVLGGHDYDCDGVETHRWTDVSSWPTSISCDLWTGFSLGWMCDPSVAACPTWPGCGETGQEIVQDFMALPCIIGGGTVSTTQECR